MTQPQPQPPRPARTARIVLVALAVVSLGLLGAAAWAASRPSASEWFAYAPLSRTTYVPAGGPSFEAAVLLLFSGALLLGGVVGFVVGRRGRSVASSDDGGS